MTTGSVLVTNGRLLNVESGQYEERNLLIVDGKIADDDAKTPDGVREVDTHGGFVLPGLIDAHVHVTAATANLGALRSWHPSYIAAHTANIMGRMLDRGFTTVRDVGGADAGTAQAQREGLIRGPRLLFGGKAISQTGGHGDDRPAGSYAYDENACCGGLGQVADGIDEVRRAARHVLRSGADHIKVMASGGVASPTDRIDSLGYSMEELRAVVEEAEAANRYVAAHAYTPRAITRAVEAGIRTIEHANLIDEPALKLVKERGAFIVMNLVTYWALNSEGGEHGLPASSQAKVADVLDAGYRALEMAARAGVPVGFGSDLLGGMQRHQLEEFRIRADIQPAIEAIRSATTVAAQIAKMEHQIGTLAPGAFGDLIVLNGDPLDDIGALVCGPKWVVQGGEVVSGSRE